MPANWDENVHLKLGQKGGRFSFSLLLWDIGMVVLFLYHPRYTFEFCSDIIYTSSEIPFTSSVAFLFARVGSLVKRDVCYI